MEKIKRQIIFDFYNTLYNPESGKLFDGILPLLKRLSQYYRLVLISTESNKRIEEIKTLLQESYFSEIVLCTQKTLEVFQQIAAKTQETIIIGDREEEEIIIAKQLNLEAIQVNPTKENPCLTIGRIFKRRLS